MKTKMRATTALILVLVARLSLGLAYSAIVPVWEAYDEDGHFAYARYLAKYRHLLTPGDPEAEQVWEKFQPPLYYVLIAVTIAGFDLGDEFHPPEKNPYFTTGLGGVNYAVLPDELSGAALQTALAVQVARAVGVIFSTVSVIFVYRAARRIWPGKASLIWAATLLYTFWPQLLFTGSTVTNDGLITLFSAAALDLALGLSQAGFRLRHALQLAVVLGCALLTKLNAFALLPLVLAALTVSVTISSTHRVRWTSWRLWIACIGLGLLIGAAVLFLGSQEFVNQQVFQAGTVAEFLRLTRLGAIGQQPLSDFVADILQYGFRTFLASFGWGNLETYPWLYGLWSFGAGGALLGLLVALSRRTKPVPFTLLGLHIASLVALSVALAISQQNAYLVPGRYLLPGLPAVSLLLIGGWTALIPTALRVWAWKIICAGFVLVGWSIPLWTLAPAYAKPQPLMEAARKAIPYLVKGDFGGEMRLLGYALETTTIQPGGAVRLTLYWETLIAMDRNWSVFVHVIDDQGVIVAQSDRYPGRGLLATTLLPPRRTFADEYIIPLPEGTYAPSKVHVSVGLYDMQDGFRLPASTGGDSFAFGELLVQPRAGSVPNPLRQNIGEVIELSGYDLDTRAVHAGETLTVTLYWQALATMKVDYSVSVRIRDNSQKRWAMQDSWPLKGAAPTTTWQVGQIITDTYSPTLDPQTPPGQYLVEVVVYDSATLSPLRLFAPDGRRTDTQAVRLSHIRVLP